MPEVGRRDVLAVEGRIQQDRYQRRLGRRAAVTADAVLGDADQRIDRLQADFGILRSDPARTGFRAADETATA
jgi:hypothetical protein